MKDDINFRSEEEKKMVHKRVTVTLHPTEINRLEKIKKEMNENKSRTIARLIQQYKLKGEQ